HRKYRGADAVHSRVRPIHRYDARILPSFPAHSRTFPATNASSPIQSSRSPTSFRSTSGQPRRMGAPNGAPRAPPSTISPTALTYEESSEARKSTAWATSPGSPQRPSGTTEETNFASLADSSAETEARGPRLQIGVLVAPGATTFTRMLRGARS